MESTTGEDAPCNQSMTVGVAEGHFPLVGIIQEAAGDARPPNSSFRYNSEQVFDLNTTDIALGAKNDASEAMPNAYSSTEKSKVMMHSTAVGRESRWVRIMDRSHDGRRPRCDMIALNENLISLARGLAPSQQDHDKCQRAFEHTRQILTNRWPKAKVVLFGSFANGLSVKSSNDIDVCLIMDWVEGAESSVKEAIVREAAELLEEEGMTDVLALPKARVPVVKCLYPSTGTKIDVTVNNLLACVNTRMIADYCRIDLRLVMLVLIVKHWAKCRAVNDPYTGTLSSYCYVLMCIFHLQTRNPPILPVLQSLPPSFSAQIGEWSAEFFDDANALNGFGEENKQNLAELIWEFFEYWAWKHNYSHGVISVRVGALLSKEGKGWTRRIRNERHLLCVEDPFVLSHDLGRTVDPQTRDVLRKEFWRAATILRDSDDPFHELFEVFQRR